VVNLSVMNFNSSFALSFGGLTDWLRFSILVAKQRIRVKLL